MYVAEVGEVPAVVLLICVGGSLAFSIVNAAYTAHRKTSSSVITSSQRPPSLVETEGSANLTPATAVEVKERDDSSWIKWSDGQWRGAGAPFLHVC